jgi:AcrR family transcriptional regulator
MDPEEIIATIHIRRAPMMAASARPAALTEPACLETRERRESVCSVAFRRAGCRLGVDERAVIIRGCALPPLPYRLGTCRSRQAESARALAAGGGRRSRAPPCGPRRVTARAVAREAQVATGPLYNHFVDKDELLVALFAERMLEAGQRLTALAGRASTGTARDNLIEIFAASLDTLLAVAPQLTVLMARHEFIPPAPGRVSHSVMVRVDDVRPGGLGTPAATAAHRTGAGATGIQPELWSIALRRPSAS